MKPIIPILVIALIFAAYLSGRFHGRVKTPASPQQLTLEQILSIRELHLVKHTYHDLFFLHKHNDQSKAIRAMVQVPVTLTAYLNLKEVKIVWSGDSIIEMVLPAAQLNDPVYHIDRMTIRETHTFQLHAGKDLYPLVARYVSDLIQQRMDTSRNLAIANRILIQAEAEGKEYIEALLKTLGHTHIVVTFGDAAKDQEVEVYVQHHLKEKKKSAPPRTFTAAPLEPFQRCRPGQVNSSSITTTHFHTRSGTQFK